MQLLDQRGHRYGRLLVIERSANVGKNTMWLCRCDCGTEKAVALQHLKSGKTQSCNCLNAEAKRARQTKHGDAPFNMPRPAEYRIWRHMKSRCLNPNVTGFEDYGGRGITICDEWRDDYSAFLRDMGRRPTPRHSIDRFPNNNGNYEPSNCRWATCEQQARNRRNVRITEESAAEIRRAAAHGIARRVLQQRYGVSKSVVALIIRGQTWRQSNA